VSSTWFIVYSSDGNIPRGSSGYPGVCVYP